MLHEDGGGTTTNITTSGGGGGGNGNNNNSGVTSDHSCNLKPLSRLLTSLVYTLARKCHFVNILRRY